MHFLYCFFSVRIGIIGITTDVSWPEPESDTAENRQAAETSIQFYVSTKHNIDNCFKSHLF